MSDVTIELRFADGVVQVTGSADFVEEIEDAIAGKPGVSVSTSAESKTTGKSRREHRTLRGRLRRTRAMRGRRRVISRIM